jgi:phosphonate transport system substrate-binding protein
MSYNDSMKSILTLLCAASLVLGDVLHFGVIATMDVNIMKEKMQPLIAYLEKETGHTIVFSSGRNYNDTIEKFVDGSYDIGYIGPAPYVLATQKTDKLQILAGLESNHSPYFHSAIVVKKNSDIRSLTQLQNKDFAFGSRHSTLSYYLPMSMLIEANMHDKLKHIHFLGRHDRVAEYVIMGRYDAGSVKESVAAKYAKYLDVIAKSEPIYDFCIVANTGMNAELRQKITQSLLKLKEKTILSAIKESATGFTKRLDSDYDNLRYIMKKVELIEK